MTQQEITEDVQYKKEAVQYTVDAAKKHRNHSKIFGFQ